MRIEVTIPGMIRDTVGGQTRFTIDAATLADALEVLKRDYPLLRVHLWDDTGQLRPHILLFHNDNGLRWMKHLDIPLQSGDRLQVVQAVSGG